MPKIIIKTSDETMSFETDQTELTLPELTPKEDRPCAYVFKTKGEGLIIVGRNVLENAIVEFKP